MVFPVVMYGCESWTIKKAEHWWRRFLRVPWTVRKSKESILKEIKLAYSLEELMLKLKLQYFGHLMWRPNSMEKTLMLEGWRQKEKGMTKNEMVGRHHWIKGHEFEKIPGDSEGQGGLVCCSPWGRKELDTTEWLNKNWHHSSKAPILQCSAFFIVQLSHPFMTIGKTITLTRQTFVGKIKKIYTNKLICKTERLRDFEKNLWLPKWKGGEEG